MPRKRKAAAARKTTGAKNNNGGNKRSKKKKAPPYEYSKDGWRRVRWTEYFGFPCNWELSDEEDGDFDYSGMAVLNEAVNRGLDMELETEEMAMTRTKNPSSTSVAATKPPPKASSTTSRESTKLTAITPDGSSDDDGTKGDSAEKTRSKQNTAAANDIADESSSFPHQETAATSSPAIMNKNDGVDKTDGAARERGHSATTMGVSQKLNPSKCSKNDNKVCGEEDAANFKNSKDDDDVVLGKRKMAPADSAASTAARADPDDSPRVRAAREAVQKAAQEIVNKQRNRATKRKKSSESNKMKKENPPDVSSEIVDLTSVQSTPEKESNLCQDNIADSTAGEEESGTDNDNGTGNEQTMKGTNNNNAESAVEDKAAAETSDEGQEASDDHKVASRRSEETVSAEDELDDTDRERELAKDKKGDDDISIVVINDSDDDEDDSSSEDDDNSDSDESEIECWTVTASNTDTNTGNKDKEVSDKDAKSNPNDKRVEAKLEMESESEECHAENKESGGNSLEEDASVVNQKTRDRAMEEPEEVPFEGASAEDGSEEVSAEKMDLEESSGNDHGSIEDSPHEENRIEDSRNGDNDSGTPTPVTASSPAIELRNSKFPDAGVHKPEGMLPALRNDEDEVGKLSEQAKAQVNQGDSSDAPTMDSEVSDPGKMNATQQDSRDSNGTGTPYIQQPALRRQQLPGYPRVIIPSSIPVAGPYSAAINMQNNPPPLGVQHHTVNPHMMLPNTAAMGAQFIQQMFPKRRQIPIHPHPAYGFRHPSPPWQAHCSVPSPLANLPQNSQQPIQINAAVAPNQEQEEPKLTPPNHTEDLADSIPKVQSKRGDNESNGENGHSNGLFIRELRHLDIICDRGGKGNHHIGNKRFRLVVSNIKASYHNMEADISRAIVDHVIETGGRFVRKDETTGQYFIVSKAEARKKASQALREGDCALGDSNKHNTTAADNSPTIESIVGQASIIETHTGAAFTQKVVDQLAARLPCVASAFLLQCDLLLAGRRKSQCLAQQVANLREEVNTYVRHVVPTLKDANSSVVPESRLNLAKKSAHRVTSLCATVHMNLCDELKDVERILINRREFETVKEDSMETFG